MSIEIDLNDVNAALLDQVTELSNRLARTTAVIKAQQQTITDLEVVIANLTVPVRPPDPPG